MPSFSDFTFYRDTYHGQLDETAYARSVHAAHTEIVSQTNGRARTAPESMQENIKLCECALVDVIAAYRETEAMLPRGVASVSNDGFSVSVGTGGTASVARKEAQERAGICASYLQWPVNLMCRWL